MRYCILYHNLIQLVICRLQTLSLGVWRDEYLVVDFEAFQETRVGLHIADHDTKEIYVLGTARDDKQLHSFYFRTGAIRPLADDGLIVQTSTDAPLDVPWADDIICAMDSTDAYPAVDSQNQITESSTPFAFDEEDFLEVRGFLFTPRTC